MSNPRNGSFVYFNALAKSGRVRKRKPGRRHMVLKGVDVIDWVNEGNYPARLSGQWKPLKLLKEWDGLFGDTEAIGRATFEVGGKRKSAIFNMSKPRLKGSDQILSFTISEVGMWRKYDKLTGMDNNRLSNISLFIDSSASKLHYCGNNRCVRDNQSERDLAGFYAPRKNLSGNNFSGSNMYQAVITESKLYEANFSGANLYDADLSKANLTKANLTGANLTNANLTNANLDGATWSRTICPDGSKNDGTSPCTAEQLNLV